jgi:hypothetical protein
MPGRKRSVRLNLDKFMSHQLLNHARI